MHLADGIINTPLCLAADLASLALVYWLGRNTDAEEIPKMGLIGAALFVASLIHFPFGGTSIHLGLYGIAGIILGKRSFPVVFTALFLQTLIFQHGGILTVGVNSINMGSGALAAWLIWRIAYLPEWLRAPGAGFIGIAVPAVLVSAEFYLSGYGKSIFYLSLIFLTTAMIESGITWVIVRFLRKVHSDILPVSRQSLN